MIESPLIQKFTAQRIHEVIVAILKDRFEMVPRDVSKSLRAVTDEKKLKTLAALAGKCLDLDAFRAALLA